MFKLDFTLQTYAVRFYYFIIHYIHIEKMDVWETQNQMNVWIWYYLKHKSHGEGQKVNFILCVI